MPPRFGPRFAPLVGTVVFVAIAVVGLVWLERRPPVPSTGLSSGLQPTIQATIPSATQSATQSASQPMTQPATGLATKPTVAPSPPSTAAPAVQSSANPLPSAAPGAATYWVDDRNNRVAFSRQAIGPSKTTTLNPEGQLRQAIESLLTSKTETTSIPANTHLRSLKMRDRNNIYIDLSQEFVTGGGTASMSARVGQVLLTATSLDPSARLWLSVEGELLRELGGEGIEIPQPLTKAEFEKNFGL